MLWWIVVSSEFIVDTAGVCFIFICACGGLAVRRGLVNGMYEERNSYDPYVPDYPYHPSQVRHLRLSTHLHMSMLMLGAKWERHPVLPGPALE